MDAQRLLGRVACRATAAATTTTTTTTAAATAVSRCSHSKALAFRIHTSAAPSARRGIWTGPAAAARVFAPTASCLSTSSSSSASPLLFSALAAHRPSDRRYQSTASRTKRARNIAPHPSFLPASVGGVVGGASKPKASKLGGDSPATALGVIPPTPATTTTTSSASTPATLLLYNPPASTPSVYQTPFKFLPKTDPRRRTNLTALFQQAQAQAQAASSSDASTGTPLAPELPHRSYDPPPQKYHLSEEDVAEMRRLRALDPLEWSVLRLARHFQCSPIFVMLAVRSSAEHRQRRQEALAAVRQRWGPIRTKARDDRRKRREMLYNGEL